MNKSLLLLFSIFIFSSQLFAETLTDDIRFGNSGLYFEPTVKSGFEYSTAGMNMRWFFRHVFSVGITYNHSDKIKSENSDYYYDAKLYGLSMNYTFDPESLVHVNIFGSLGGGILRLMEENEPNDELDRSPIKYLELGLSGELNIAKYLRTAIGVVYSYAQHSMEDSVDNSKEIKLSQPMIFIGFKLGVF